MFIPRAGNSELTPSTLNGSVAHSLDGLFRKAAASLSAVTDILDPSGAVAAGSFGDFFFEPYDPMVFVEDNKDAARLLDPVTLLFSLAFLGTVLLLTLALLELEVRQEEFACSLELFPSRAVAVEESNSTPSMGIPLSFNRSRSFPILRFLTLVGPTKLSVSGGDLVLECDDDESEDVESEFETGLELSNELFSDPVASSL